MEPIKHSYKKENNYYVFRFENNNDEMYKRFRGNNILIKKKNENIILKIKANRKFKFLRIYFKILTLDNIWFGKFPNSEDLILLKVIEENMHYDVLIFQNEWKHRFMLLDLITSNPNIYL